MSATPAAHFQLALYATIAQVIDQVTQAQGSQQAALNSFPFLKGYAQELARVMPPDGTPDWWQQALLMLEAQADTHLPLHAVREAADLSLEEMRLWLAAGLPELDPRFGLLFEASQVTPGLTPVSLGLLTHWWRHLPDARHSLRRLTDLGLLVGTTPELTLGTPLHLPSDLWDALRGQPTGETTTGWTYTPSTQQPHLSALVLPEALRRTVRQMLPLVRAGQLRTVLVRGPSHNGRRTLLCALARTLGVGTLELSSLPSPPQWRTLGPLCTALNAMPVLELEMAASETAPVNALSCYSGPLGVVMGRQGILVGVGAEALISLPLDLPTPVERRALWALHQREPLPGLPQLSRGHLVRLAHSLHLTQNGETPAKRIRTETRRLGQHALEGLATPLETFCGWADLSVDPETQAELHLLARRILQREYLPELLRDTPHAPSVGVKALLSGPSGTGKTLAARVLAGVLERDLYRLDLSGLVNKYIGETEKNLERLFSRAEELDILLLLDEGDSLLTARTNVQSANDRYANLETNYLLQRLESFSGVLLITSNSAERIDHAFQRRMDAIIEFRAPQAPQRLNIWSLHLAPGHRVSSALLNQLATRCPLSGGQIRNAAIHALLLALDDQQPLDDHHLQAAVEREYRKLGQHCPLRRTGPATPMEVTPHV